MKDAAQDVAQDVAQGAVQDLARDVAQDMAQDVAQDVAQDLLNGGVKVLFLSIAIFQRRNPRPTLARRPQRLPLL